MQFMKQLTANFGRSLLNAIKRNLRKAEQKELGWEAFVIGNSLTILTYLYRASKDMHAKPLKAEKPELLDRVMAYIEENLAQKISLAEVSKHFYVSESTVSQLFRLYQLMMIVYILLILLNYFLQRHIYHRFCLQLHDNICCYRLLW